ncbi:MAG: hypothetical protein A2W31_10515 [Planctomycetes bacterium RBG_16_64_10]|nr:MAG: hypothetical protein A2W31_10515 [Planctomycetes bacterium RBG_16_64_10]
MSRHGPSEMDLLICCNISRYDSPGTFSYEPATSVRLRHHFGFDQALVFDVCNACAGMFTGIRLADILLQTGSIRTAMIVSGEYITHLTRSAQKELTHRSDPRLACLTLGDAGAAVILTRSTTNAAGFQELELYTLPQYASYCVAKLSDQPHGEAIMLTDSLAVTGVLIAAINRGLSMLQRDVSLRTRLQHFIPHQTSSTTIKATVREVNRMLEAVVLDESNVIDIVPRRGNTASTSHFVAVHDGILAGRIAAGDTILFGIGASGITTGGAVYTCDDLPDRLRQQNRHVVSMESAHAEAVGSCQSSPSLVFCARQAHVRLASVGVVPLRSSHPGDTLTLAVAAARDCLSRSRYEARDIDLLLFAGIYRTDFVFEPAIATFIACELGINTGSDAAANHRFLAFDVFNSSIGFLQAMYLATRDIQMGKSRRVMIVAAEIEHHRGMPDSMLRGIAEVGSAVILDQAPDPPTGFGMFGFKYDTASIADFSMHITSGGRLTGHAPRRFEQRYIAHVRALTDDVLKRSNLDKAAIKAVFPPQVSNEFLHELSDRLAIPREKFVAVVGDNDLFSSSLPYGLRCAQEQGLVTAGDIGLLISVGVGIQVGCAVYYF